MPTIWELLSKEQQAELEKAMPECWQPPEGVEYESSEEIVKIMSELVHGSLGALGR
uniref:Uncharacterized protein n=1 Tax=viral metagenome TaxID=1070528 RepID=A0A6M3KB33_9ZZZZ